MTDRDAARSLCEKYTALNPEQIAEIETWLDELGKIANTENCNVYIDCLTFYGNSMVVVAEAKPEGRAPLYDKPILGAIIKSGREPAVERAFASGQPTVGVLGLEMPTTKKVVQSAYPIYDQDEVIAVLIYEKVVEAYEPHQEEPEEVLLLPEIASFLETMTDAVLVADRNGKISYSNTAARQLFYELGYIDSLKGMPVSNLVAFRGEQTQDFCMSGHFLHARKALLDSRQGIEGVIIADVTELEQTKEQLRKSRLANVELRHSTKNGLRLLEFADREYAKKLQDKRLRAACLAQTGRLRALRTVLEIKLENEKAGLRTVLERLSRELTALLGEQETRVRILVEGDDLSLQEDLANAVILIIYELICNALKHAFRGREEGTIRIGLKEDDVICTFRVEDNGCGFDASGASGNASVGLSMLRAIVRDWLNSELVIETGPEGTSISFDVIE